MNNVQLDEPLLSLLEPWYREIADYQEICQTETAQLEILAGSINAVAQNFFFQTMDESSVARWEQAIGITPNPQTEDLQFRRDRVLNRISTKPPFTLGFLYQKLNMLLGAGNYEIEVDYPNYTLYVKSSAQNQLYAQEISYTINTIKPCHIVYINMPLLSDSVLLDETVSLAKIIWNYRLGYWGLGELPFTSIENKGVIVTPTQRTIQPGMLANVANFLQTDVASARINGSIVISDVSASVSGATATFTYTVTPAQTSEVTLIELLDAGGNVLTSATVYVPVTDATTFSHEIIVKEDSNG